VSVSNSRKHIRRQASEVNVEYVTVDETGLVITVRRPDWRPEREFEFFFLLPFASLALAQAIALAFGLFAARFARKTALGRYEGFRRMWRVVAAQASHPPNASNLRSGELAEWWAKRVHEYGVAAFNNATKATSAKTDVQGLETVLGELSSCGLLADVAKVEPPKNLHLRKVPRPGFFELSASSQPAPREAASELVKHFRSIGVPVEDKEAEDFIGLVAALLTPAERKDPAKINEIYLKRTQEHLAALTSAAEEQYLRWATHYAEGQALIEQADPRILSFYDEGRLNTSLEDFRRVLPANNSATATANLLLLARERFDGRIPSSNALPMPLGSRFLALVNSIGGVYHLDAMLILHRSAVAAAAILYLIDSGANLSTALSLEEDFERPTSEPGVVEFFGVKARANYAAIYDALPVNLPGREISTVKALRGVLTMTGHLRQNFPQLGKSLFVFKFFQTPSIANSTFLALQMRYLLAAKGLPPGWKLSGIRAAVGIVEALDGSGTLKGIKRKLHHGSKSMLITEGYALRWPIRWSLELQMAKYQELLQAGMASNLDGALAWLSKSPHEAEQLLSEVRRKGLGFLLKESGPAPQPATGDEISTGSVGDDAEHCIIHLFVADEQSLSEVIAVKKSLELNIKRLEDESATRFENLWLELLAFATAVIAEAMRSPFAYLIPRAERNAAALMAAGFDVTGLRL